MDQQDRTATFVNAVNLDTPSGRDYWIWPIIAGQVIVNFFFLTKRTLWVDEAYSAILARRSIGEIHAALRFDAGPPLYYDLLHLWRCLFGESELALRSLSLLLAAITTFGVYAFACRCWDRKTALAAACLFALAPLTIAYAQEARNYTLLAALCLGFGIALMQYLERGEKKSLAAAGLLGLALVYTHNMGWFILAAGGVYTFLAFPGQKRLFPLVGCGAAVVLFYLPWVPTLLAQMQNSERTIAWIRAFWSPWSIAGTFSAFIPGGFNPPYLQLPAFPWRLQAINGLLFLVVFALGCLAARRERDHRALSALVFLFGGLLGPYCYSLFHSPIYLAGRTDYGLFPFGCLFVGYGMSRIPWRAAQWALLVWFIGIAVIIDARFVLREDPVSERDGILYLQKQIHPGDVLLCTGLTRPPFEYALADRGLIFQSFPRDMETQLAHLNEAWYDKHIDGQNEAESVLRESLQSLPSGAQLWVIYSQRVINEPLYDLLDSGRCGRIAASISTPRLGLRKLGEPVVLLRVEPLAKLPRSNHFAE